MNHYVKIHPDDNVIILVADMLKDEYFYTGENKIILSQDVKSGHKIAITDIPNGSYVIKYGYPIGTVNTDIHAGDFLHTHNMKTTLEDKVDYIYEPVDIQLNRTISETFMGYRRKNGKIGIRNHVWIIPTVGCVNRIATILAQKGKEVMPDGVEDIIAFPHPYGCSQMGDDQETSRIIISNLILHPNAGAVLVVGLGCENSNISVLKNYLGDIDKDRVKFINCQDVDDEIDTGFSILSDLMNWASQFKREIIPASELIVGLKCGGSDGFSGITANPAVGRFSDILVSQGGTSILTEVPEMFGAETILMNRCINKAVFNKTVKLINDFKDYFKAANQTIYENPSPGNKDGGISTLEDKSLGCTQKSGSAPVCDVLDYGAAVKTKGLNLLSAPGNDLVASTALAASGAHIVLFTTGRGTPFSSPVPTMKISSNSSLDRKKTNWIDFNAGIVLEGSTIDAAGEKLFEKVLSIASGEKVKSEIHGFQDMAIFKRGVTL